MYALGGLVVIWWPGAGKSPILGAPMNFLGQTVSHISIKICRIQNTTHVQYLRPDMTRRRLDSPHILTFVFGNFSLGSLSLDNTTNFGLFIYLLYPKHFGVQKWCSPKHSRIKTAKWKNPCYLYKNIHWNRYASAHNNEALSLVQSMVRV